MPHWFRRKGPEPPIEPEPEPEPYNAKCKLCQDYGYVYQQVYPYVHRIVAVYCPWCSPMYKQEARNGD